MAQPRLVQRYAPRRLIAALLLLGAVVAPVAVLEPTSFDAEAHITMQRINSQSAAAADFASDIFSNGRVERRVREVLGGGRGSEEIIPHRVSLVIEPGNVLLRVIGHHSNPDTAADIANFAADTYLIELNQSWEGKWTPQRWAEPPSPPPGVARDVVLAVVLAVTLAATGFALLALGPTVTLGGASPVGS